MEIVLGYFDAVFMDSTKDRHSTMRYIFFYRVFYRGCAIPGPRKNG